MKECKSPASKNATAIEDGLIMMAVAPAFCEEEFRELSWMALIKQRNTGYMQISYLTQHRTRQSIYV